MGKIRLFEMFAGYGGASFALKKAGIPFECVGYSEIDKYAIQCYNQNHKKNWVRLGNKPEDLLSSTEFKNYGDATKINPQELPDFDLLTGGFPCQAFSVAGKRKGMEDTRGTLIYDILRIAKEKKPKYMLLENVKGLLSHNKGSTWQTIKWAIKGLGYDIKYKVLNSKDFGIPQNRERIWILCSLNSFVPFLEVFPREERLSITVKDLLEEKVDNKYYLSVKVVKTILNRNHKKFDGIAPCMSANMFKLNESMPIVHSTQPRSGDPKKGGTGALNRNDGITYCIDTANCQAVQIFAIRGRGENNNQTIEKRTDGCSNSLTTVEKDNYIELTYRHSFEGFEGYKDVSPSIKSSEGSGNQIIIKDVWRRLTPTECFRLMGFLDDKINLDGLSDTQKYKLAGNGWDVNLVSKIFKTWLKPQLEKGE